MPIPHFEVISRYQANPLGANPRFQQCGDYSVVPLLDFMNDANDGWKLSISNGHLMSCML